MKNNVKQIWVWVWVSGFIPIFGDFGCGYETLTQNPKPDFFGCECMVFSDNSNGENKLLTILYNVPAKTEKRIYFKDCILNIFVSGLDSSTLYVSIMLTVSL